jgi:hypothetical protein
MEESSVVYITMQEKTGSSRSRRRKLAGQNNCCIFGKREMGPKIESGKSSETFLPYTSYIKRKRKSSRRRIRCRKTEIAYEE